MNVEKNRHTYFSLANVLTLLAMTGAIATVWVALAADNAKQKERVDNLNEETKEIKRDVKDTKENVQLILRKLEGWEATQRERDRQARERRQ